ncbi:hypothetical protein R3P38DRAFT_2808306 [Favolaschia claudopus]|uniref:Uncharacterized protein n=1 Tax=Favolaschia claudopus TaxID=2862362 RepID=A0AAV9ZFR9_9AGAR
MLEYQRSQRVNAHVSRCAVDGVPGRGVGGECGGLCDTERSEEGGRSDSGVVMRDLRSAAEAATSEGRIGRDDSVRASVLHERKQKRYGRGDDAEECAGGVSIQLRGTGGKGGSGGRTLRYEGREREANGTGGEGGWKVLREVVKEHKIMAHQVPRLPIETRTILVATSGTAGNHCVAIYDKVPTVVNVNEAKGVIRWRAGTRHKDSETRWGSSLCLGVALHANNASKSACGTPGRVYHHRRRAIPVLEDGGGSRRPSMDGRWQWWKRASKEQGKLEWFPRPVTLV